MIKPDLNPDGHPIVPKLVMVDAIVTLEGQEGHLSSMDVEFLNHIEECYCAYGACDCRIYPFSCTINPKKEPPTGSDILSALGATKFKSQHIANLGTPTIPYPGYHPGTDNDEIHTDPAEQAIFSKEDDGDYTEELHKSLRERVVDNRLYYVLLHEDPKQYGEDWFSEWVVLFGVGVSKESGNLLGVLTHQLCHNYCD